ncbi:MAG TPA: GNAT family N-acetyltransferase [Thermoanaerobaculia bacterium]|jgi:hypothetical protein|nr:GNAT family N-acetyltransferase [Thermoanaerobaculia bacterium]
MQGSIATVTFRLLRSADLETLHDWLGRLHVSEWWGPAPSLAEVETDYLPIADPESTTRGYVALLAGRPIEIRIRSTVLQIEVRQPRTE